jgi:hypothetical protein
MTPLREIRTIHACPLVGPPQIPSRTKTNTFVVGHEGCVRLELDESSGLAWAVGERPEQVVAVHVAQCEWVKPAAAQGNARKDGAHNPAVAEYPPGTSEPSPKERDKAAHGSGASPAGAPKPGVVKGKK